MSKSRPIVTLMAVSALMGLGLAGCKVNGGGWIDSAFDILNKENNDKATFGFNAECFDTDGDDETDYVKGHFQYHDHGSTPQFLFGGKTVRFHGVLDDTLFNACEEPQPEGTLTTWFGHYNAQPRKLGSGLFEASFIDGGEPGPSSGDFVQLTVLTGVFAGYFNAGVLGGGNIQQID
jgi:hypothetical protein